MKRLIKFFVLTALLCLSAACSQTFENMNTATTQKAQGRLVMSVGSTSRTLTPTIPASSIKSAVLSANGKEIKTWDSKNQTVIEKIENDSDILLDLGTYEFELVFYTQHDEILQIGKCNHEVTAGTNYITFNMQIAYSGTGNNYSIAQLYVNWEDTYKVDKVKAGLYDIETREVITYIDIDGKSVTCEETEEIRAGKTNYSYIKTGVPAGQYLFKCELYYGENLLNTVIEVIKIIDGIGTADAIHINKLNGFYTVTYQTDGTWNDGFVPTTIRSKITGVTLPTADQITNGDCEFQGWYDDDGNKITEIPAGTIKDFVFTSKWKMTCTTDTLIERLKNTKVGIYDIIVTGTMTEDIITSINDSLLDEVYEYPDYVIKKREKLKINLDLSQTTGMTSIPDRTFLECCNFVNITLSDDVTSIGADAFFDCENLESITLPAGVTTIENSAFSGCDKLTDVYISDFDAWYNIEFSNNYSNPLYCNGNLYLNGNLVTELVIPDSVTSISHFAFNGCNSITSVVIPVSMTSIGESTFYKCDNLTNVTFENTENWFIEKVYPGGQTEILDADVTDSAENATYLKEENKYCRFHKYDKSVIPVTAGNVVEKLSNLAASDAIYIINLSGTVTEDTINSINPLLQNETKKINLDLSNATGLNYIGKNAFKECDSLINVILPDSVTDIRAHAFDRCYNLMNINIPNNVTHIGHKAFYQCRSLTSAIMPDSVTSLDDGATSCCDSVSMFSGCVNLTEAKLPKNITSIGSQFFDACKSLTNILIPDNVTTIKIGAFSLCNKLKSVNLPEGLTTLEECAFADCYSLTEVVIPDSVTSIGSSAFSCCNALQSVTLGKGIKGIEPMTFWKCLKLTKISIPDSLTYIGHNVFQNCPKLEYNEYKGCLYLGNTDNPYILFMKVKDEYTTSIDIHPQTKVISNDTLNSYGEITNITIPESVVYIHDWAFDLMYKTWKNTTFNVDKNNQYYSSSDDGKMLLNKDKTILMAYISATGDITIPEGVIKIQSSLCDVFNHNNNITSVTIPSSMTKLKSDTFYGCSNLKSVIFVDTSTWYQTINSDYTGGTAIDVTNPTTNVTKLQDFSPENLYYWYKE